MKLHRIARGLALALVVFACSSEPSMSGTDPACRQGDTRACLGPGQCAGAQVCLPNGSGFASCDCGGGGQGGAAGAAGTTGGSSGTSTSGGAAGSGAAGAGGTGAGAGGVGAGGVDGGSGAGSGPTTGGTGGAGASDGSPTGGGGGSGGHAGTDPCPTGGGADMVRFTTTDGTTFCMDKRVVTRDQYQAFVSTAGPGELPAAPCPVDPLLDLVCVGSGGLRFRARGCQAEAYCRWAGKRLCGMLDGSVPTTPADLSRTEWYHVCWRGGFSAAGCCEECWGGNCCTGDSAPFDQVENLLSGVTLVGGPGWSGRLGGDRQSCSTSGISVELVESAGGFRCCAD